MAPEDQGVGVFQKSEPALASQQAPQILKFQRPDWALFRTVEGLRRWRDKAHAERKRDAKPEATP